MTGDTFTERRGFVKKSSGLGGSILFIVALGLVVGAAGVAGLHYGATHGWDQPSSPGPAATEPVATEAPTATATSVATDQVETTSATLPVASASATPEPQAAAADKVEKPKPKPYVAPRPKPKPEPANDTPSTGDPFGTQQ